MNEGKLVPATKPQRLLSVDLAKNIELSNEQLYEIGGKVKKYKKKLNDAMDKMDEYMDKHTSKERQAVEEALNALYKKVDKVKSDDNYKNMEKEVEYIEEKLNITMKNIFPYYAKAVRRIYNSYPNKDEREKKLLQFHEVVGDAFLTKDEKNILSQLRNQIKEIPHKVVEIPLIGFSSQD